MAVGVVGVFGLRRVALFAVALCALAVLGFEPMAGAATTGTAGAAGVTAGAPAPVELVARHAAARKPRSKVGKRAVASYLRKRRAPARRPARRRAVRPARRARAKAKAGKSKARARARAAAAHKKKSKKKGSGAAGKSHPWSMSAMGLVGALLLTPFGAAAACLYWTDPRRNEPREPTQAPLLQRHRRRRRRSGKVRSSLAFVPYPPRR